MKIALVVNDDFSLWHFRKGLIEALVKAGHEVHVITPAGPFVPRLVALGTTHIVLPMQRFMSILSDLRVLVRLYRIFREQRYDVVHNMTIKPNIYGTIAASLAGIKKTVCLVSGMGFMFAGSAGFLSRLVQSQAGFLYKIAMSLSKKTWFQNPDDLEYFVHNGIIKPEKGLVILSGGINTSEYSSEAIPQASIDALRDEFSIPRSSKCVLMVAARMIWSKGVREFCEAAAILEKRFPGWKFIMVCPREEGSPDSVPENYIRDNKPGNLIAIDTFRLDIKDFIAMAEIMVLPSYYREGVPRALLEGLSMGKSVVTTDSIGCREVVKDGRNGFLVPVKDSSTLAERLSVLMGDDRKRSAFGENSRKLAIDVFDEKKVVNRVITELYGIPSETGAAGNS